MEDAYRFLKLATLSIGVWITADIHAETPGPRIHDYTGTFQKFWSENRDRSLSEQIEAFKKEVEPSFAEFYQYKREKWKRAGKDPDTEVGKELLSFPAIEKKFEAKALVISEEITASLKGFLKTFDDFETDFDVYIVHSLGEMDGGTRQINGKMFFVLGIDGIVKHHKGTTDIPFFHHELFHVYHGQKVRGVYKIWGALWGEGLATYVSLALNPNSTFQDIMLDTPAGLVQSCQEKFPELWSLLSQNLSSESESEYTRWFLLSSQDPLVPRRAGYYLGFLIAQELHRGRTLKDLAQLQGTQLLELIQSKIKDLSGQ
jgi:hypothetical protein